MDLLPWQQPTAVFDHPSTRLARTRCCLQAMQGRETRLCLSVCRMGFVENQRDNAQGVTTACGQCQSCQWLIANTHPDLYQIPTPTVARDASPKSQSKQRPRGAS